MTTTVRSIMQTDVLTVTPETSVPELARLLSDNGVSGVPVISGGRLAGVVSTSDVVRLAAEEGRAPPAAVRWVDVPGEPEGDPEDEVWEPSEAYFLPEDRPTGPGRTWDEGAWSGGLAEATVADVMTPVTFSISPDATVEELADFLLRGRIHRAVVEEDGRLLGIVTTFDLLTVVAARAGAASPGS